ncbi:MAG TPA: tetratricopeptide repeat protein [Kofleriaceae bacterium]|nr:tetratricopeptide repeat protein [Kofleriaceae bacterium]
MKRTISIVCALVMVPVLAAAQPKSAEDWYKEGETQYNLGNFDKAVDAFKQGFALEPNDSKKAAYLFNIAQSYRQAKNCKDAVFFYKRYLALKETDTVKPLKPEKRQEIEDRIKELDECAKQQEALRTKPPEQNEKPDGDAKPDGSKPDQVATKPDGETDPDQQVTATAPTYPRVLSVRLVGGGAKLSTGNLNVPVQATFGLIGGYPLHISDQLGLEFGAGFTFTPVPFTNMVTNESGSGQFVGLMGNASATYEVAPKVGLRGDLGLGVLVINGVGESPFTDGQPVTGALSSFHVRAGVSADYAFTPNLVGTVAPIAVSFSPSPKGFRDDISSIIALDFMVGLGYRM